MKKEAIKYFLSFLNQGVEFVLPTKEHVSKEQHAQVRLIIDKLDAAFPARKTDLFQQKRDNSLRNYHAQGGGIIIGSEITESDVA